jgi:CBS domain containing-hemolysin-like protein
VGISVASLGLGMYGEHVLAEWIAVRLEALEQARWIAAHALASVIAIGFLTYLHIVLGEMVPKALALQRAARTVLYVTPLILAIETALLPVIVALNAIGNGLLRLVGVRREAVAAERYHTTEELQYIIEESQEGGLLRGESGEILRDLFQFGDLTAGEVMVPRVMLTGIAVGTSRDELQRIVRTNVHTRYPVYNGSLDNIIGSLHIKQILRHLVADGPVTARDARPLPYVPGPMPLDEVLAAMRRYRAQMAVVMDQHGGTAGLVTMEDLFEEVVGDIEEAHGPMSIVQLAPGRIRARGTVRLQEAGEALGCNLEYPKVTTISGLVLTLLGRPTTVGDTVTWQNARIEVTAVAGRGVAEAVLMRISPPDA